MAERRSLTFGPFRLDLWQSYLWREEQPVAIRPQALTVLRYLVLHADRIRDKYLCISFQTSDPSIFKGFMSFYTGKFMVEYLASNSIRCASSAVWIEHLGGDR
jgi:hypothetical protein